jgi:hypothetical protein
MNDVYREGKGRPKIHTLYSVFDALLKVNKFNYKQILFLIKSMFMLLLKISLSSLFGL